MPDETPAASQDEPREEKSAVADLASLVASMRGAEDDSDAVTLIYDTTWKAAFLHHTAMQPAAVEEKDEDMAAVRQQQQNALRADDSAWKVREMEDALFCGDDGASPRQMKAVKIPVAAPIAFCLSNGAGDYDNPAKMPFCNYILPCGGAAALHHHFHFPPLFCNDRAQSSRPHQPRGHARGGARPVDAAGARPAAGAGVFLLSNGELQPVPPSLAATSRGVKTKSQRHEGDAK